MNKNDAKKYLANVAGDKVFWVNNGSLLKNLVDLEKCLSTMSDAAYAYHANKTKNDFSNWTRNVIGDAELALSLTEAKNKSAALKKVKKRVENLKKAAK